MLDHNRIRITMECHSFSVDASGQSPCSASLSKPGNGPPAASTLGRSWKVFSTRIAFQVTTKPNKCGTMWNILDQENCTWLRNNFCFQDLAIGLQVCFSPNQIAGWSPPTAYYTFRVMRNLLFSSFLDKEGERMVQLISAFLFLLAIGY